MHTFIVSDGTEEQTRDIYEISERVEMVSLFTNDEC